MDNGIYNSDKTQTVKTQAAQSPISGASLPTIDELQVYVNRKYLKINTKIKEMSLRTEQIEAQIQDAMLEVTSAAANYFCDGNFENYKKSPDRNFEMAQNVLKITQSDGTVLSLSEFYNSNPLHITLFGEESIFEIFYKKSDFLAKFINTTPKLKRCERRTLEGVLIESLDFSLILTPEKYSSYKNGEKQYELVFDTDPMSQKFGRKNRCIPKKFTCYDTEKQSPVEVLNFLYSMPESFVEYNPSSGYVTKSFKMQGLKNLVYRYSCYSDKNGQLLSTVKA